MLDSETIIMPTKKQNKTKNQLKGQQNIPLLAS